METITEIRVEDLIAEFEKDCGFKQKPPWAVTSNWASKLAHPCERWLYHNRVDWEHQERRDWKGIGELGEILHDNWVMDRKAQGYRVIHAETPLSAKLRNEFLISGKIDGRIGKGTIKPVLYEFKSMNQYDYEKINTWDDIREHKRDYIRSYAGQITCYLYDQNEESGVMVIMNKMTMEWKWIIVNLDYELAEYMLKRAERTNKAVINKEPPQRIAYCQTCKSCEYKNVCLPDILNENGLEFVDMPELETKLKRMNELEPVVDEYEELEKSTVDTAKGVGKDFVVGTSFKCEIKNGTQTRLDTKAIPPDIKAKYEKEIKTQRITYIPLG